MFELVVERTIAAAHYLRGIVGPCERLHGHNYRIQVYIQGETLDANGMLVDFTDIKEHLMGILDRLDHQTLNDLPEFATLNPTAENIAKVIGDYLAGFSFGRGKVHRVMIWETPGQAATYYLPSF